MITEEEEMIDAVRNRLTPLKGDGKIQPSRNQKLEEAIQRLRGGTAKGTALRYICMDEYNHKPNNTVIQQIHPPRQWERRGKKCLQKVSNDCTIRKDVISLKQTFDERLKEFGTDEIGLCQHRREYFAQLFDEIIRQVSMSCVERGQLLIAVRDEMNKTFASYESLFFSAIAYGIKSQMKARKNVEDWREKIFEIKEKINDLEVIQEEFAPAYAHFQEVFDHQLEYDSKEFTQEYERLLRNQALLKDLLLNAVKDPESASATDVATTVPVGKK
jgi:dynein light intermediate chain